MRTSHNSRRSNARRYANRRGFLQMERLENRMVLSGAAPAAVNDLYDTIVDQPLEIVAPGVLANDTDAEGDPLAAGLFSGPSHGTLSLAENGSFSYTPETGFLGMDSFIYFANDGSSDSMLAAVTINVHDGGTPPTAVNDSYTVDEDGALDVASSDGLLANDTDAEGDALTAALVAGPASGTLSVSADGSFVYLPNANFAGVDSFSYTASDASGASNVAIATITVDPVNDKAIVANDAYEVDEDNSLTVAAAAGVLVNDSDIDGDTLIPSVASQPLHGTLTLNADGSFVYTPAANFNGLDGFSYLVNDGTANSDVASVTILVHSINDLPIGANDEFTTAEDTPLVIAAPGVLTNDSDVDGDALSALLVSPPQHGTVTLGADGSLLYTPDANFHGTDGFSYLANDGSGDSEVAGVTIEVTAVNDLPVATNDEFSTSEDTPLTVSAPGVLGNDTDADGDALTVALVNPPAGGSVTLNADGSFVYTPNANFHGTDGFSYVVSDGSGNSEAAGVTIEVTAVNDLPAAVNDSFHTSEDVPLTVAAPGVLQNDTDADGDTMTAALVGGTANGSVSLAADGSFVYTPSANFSGGDSFTYQVSDGTATSGAATVTIDVCPVNDPPAAVGDAYSVDEDNTLTLDAAGGVLANDTDPDGDPLTATVVTGPANGSLSLSGDGSFLYTPSANFNGTDSFVYAAGDGTLTSDATVTITVNAVADAPVPAIDNYSTGEDIPLAVDATLGVLANDNDPQGGTLTAEVVDGPSHGSLVLNSDGSFTYTPEANYHGGDSFTYKAMNGSEEMVSSANFVIEPLNDRPVAVNDEFTVDVGDGSGPAVIAPTGGVMANDSDIDGDSLTVSLVTGPGHGTLVLNPDGTFDYVPQAGFAGDDAFRYQLFDGKANSNVATATLHVSEGDQNAAPVGTADSYATLAGQTLAVDATGGVLANDSDPDGDPLTAAALTGPAHGSVSLNADGSFTYTPSAGFSGQDSFSYTANDGQADSGATTVTIDIAAQSALPPTAADDAFTAPADGTLTVAGPGVLTNDTDPEGDPLTAAVVSGPANGSLALDANGGFVYTPSAGFTGIDSFTYQASDGTGVSNTATVTLSIEATANQRPTAVNDSFTVEAGKTLTVAPDQGLLKNDTDPEGSSLVASLFNGPLHGTLSLLGDGSFTYTPNAGFSGLDSFLYRVNDGALFSALAAVTLHVTPSSSPAPAPIPEPEPGPTTPPGHCLAMGEGEGNDLLDTLVAGHQDLSSVDAVMQQGIWLT